MQASISDSQNTSFNVVVPFYIYAGLALLAACLLLFIFPVSAESFFFTPKILATVHIMALGWGTMIIIGSGYQLIPVLNERKLYNEVIALISFFPAAIGIVFLSWAFYQFNMGWPAQTGGILINITVIMFLYIIFKSINHKDTSGIHMVFLFTAAVWLLLTTLTGGLLIFNFTYSLLSKDSLHYLTLHAHMGIAGWFLLTIIGVGSKLIPMFMISGYKNDRQLWLIYFLINMALLIFIFIFFSQPGIYYYFIPLISILAALVLFMHFCYHVYKNRLRKKIDKQVGLSVTAISFIALPLIMMFVLLVLLISNKSSGPFYLLYGFTVFFGWITSLILGMTFKTLPFIIWNRHYKKYPDLPQPKLLFSAGIFSSMQWAYLSGFLVFILGLFFSFDILIHIGSALLLLTAIFYNLNVWKMFLFKPLRK